MWVGDSKDSERTNPLMGGLFRYSLDCSELGKKNIDYLTNKLDLKIEGLEQDASKSEQDLPAFLRKVIRPSCTPKDP